MSLTPGTDLGPYHVLGSLGAGGMGEVYRAHDTKLKREVAIKLLPDAFSQDADRLKRFQREAEVVASLTHPHIAAIYDLAQSGDRRFLVLELVEGETLADRIARGRIPVDEAMTIAIQIARALEAAHGKGITHRDLKPANIKITPEGIVKVLDFGLAKVGRPFDGSSPADAGLSNSPTTLASTLPGVVMGTAAYMSPEQALGKPVDHATDVWAFGCVLYEMLTARRAFDAESVGEILASVLKQEPDWSRLPPDLPESIRRLLRRCLRKDRPHRWQSIADARIEIEEATVEPGVAAPPATPSRRTERMLWGAALAVLGAAAVGAALLSSRTPPASPEMLLEVSVPPTTDPGSMAISPDGLKIAFVAMSEGRPRILIRRLDSAATSVLAGTDYAENLFWSPDGRSVAFFAKDRLQRVGIDGGSPETVLATPQNVGGGWGPDGSIYVAPRSGEPIRRVPAAGGAEPVAVTKMRAGQTSHGLPAILPDGRHLLYFVTADENTRDDSRGVHIDRLDGSLSRRVVGPDVDGAAVFHPSGHLLFVRGGSLFAQKLNLSTLALEGDAALVADQVVVVGRQPALSVSTGGTIAYRSGEASGERQLRWFDRSGKGSSTVAAPDNLNVRSAALSPDGRTVAFSRTLNGNFDLWLLDIAREVLTRATFDLARDLEPVWSHDGRTLVFRSSRTGTGDLYVKETAGAPGSERLLASTPGLDMPSAWSQDGKYVLFDTPSSTAGRDIWAVPIDAAGKAGEQFAVVQSPYDELEGKLSPDGRWIAYQSNASGRGEVWLQAFRNASRQIQVSRSGGGQIQWRRDGRELFYLAHDGQLMAVPIRVTPAGDIDPDVAVALFQTRLVGAGHPAAYERVQYSASDDGQRFLMNTLTEVPAGSIHILLNWKPRP